MAELIFELFENAQSTCIQWEGEPLYGIYEIPTPQELSVEFVRSKISPAQGLNIKTYEGLIQVNGVSEKNIVIWSDTAPQCVALRFSVQRGRKGRVKIWNVWRGTVSGKEVTQAWLGNAGMRVSPTATNNELLMRCSDCEGPVSFDDLEVRILIK